MSTINSFLQLPLRFAAQDKLQFDLASCLELHWQEHFNQGDYAGQWTGIALRSPTGKLFSEQEASPLRDTSADVLFEQLDQIKKASV